VEACKITGHDAPAVADGVAAVLERAPGVAAADRRAAREWIAGHLSTQVIGQRLVDGYEALLGGRPYPAASDGNA
jgi:hypothetical protein